MSNWYETIEKKTARILAQIKEHEFIKELVEGTLPEDVFLFYIQQDALYLSNYKRVLATLGIKCTDEEESQFFLDAATGIIEVENELHQSYLKQRVLPEPTPTCELYNSYLSRMVHTRPLAEGLAAVLPCFTIYKQVGDYILTHQTNRENNPYQDWINTYGGEEFAKSVATATEITNRHAQMASEKVLANMDRAYEKASKLEWMFWDSAYKKEVWRV